MMTPVEQMRLEGVVKNAPRWKSVVGQEPNAESWAGVGTRQKCWGREGFLEAMGIVSTAEQRNKKLC